MASLASSFAKTEPSRRWAAAPNALRQAGLPISRRGLLAAAGFGGLCWLTPLAEALAQRAERSAQRAPAQSVILLWLAGGPSQLETFDPHPGTDIAAGTGAIATAVPGIKLAAGFERLAEQVAHLSIVRSLVSKEGDHERGTYLVKTGYRPDPTIVHPAIGAICCHELPAGTTEIPRHVSILPNQWPARGGFLGNRFDAFKTFDPAEKVPDVASRVTAARDGQRLADRALVDEVFLASRRSDAAVQYGEMIERARALMGSAQLRAFDVGEEPATVRAAYGDTPFGRGCLAARRLIEQGVRCVEVTLAGWDSHANNHETHRQLIETLDPALAALLADLAQRDLLAHTVVLCGGEFGRTPRLNPLAGRDHWPHGFSMALAGGGLRGGQVIGATDPEGGRTVVEPHAVADVHATILSALGIDPAQEVMTPVGRPIKFCEGTPIAALVAEQSPS